MHPRYCHAEAWRPHATDGIEPRVRGPRVRSVEPAENRNGRSLWHDYGLVEFVWEFVAERESWRGTRFSVQVHQFGGGLDDVLRSAMAHSGATAPEAIAFDALRQTSASAGRPGHVHKIIAPYYAADADLTDVASTGMGAAARYLTTLDPEGQRAWLARQPASQTSNPSWWLHLYRHVDDRIRQQPQHRAQWVILRLLLLDQAAAVGPFSPREHVEARAPFVGELFARGIATDLYDALPTADELVRACLAAIPTTIAEVTSVDGCHVDPPHTAPLIATDLSREIR